MFEGLRVAAGAVQGVWLFAVGLPPLPPGLDISLVDVPRVRGAVCDSFMVIRVFTDREDEDCSYCIVKNCKYVIFAPSLNSHTLFSVINNVWVPASSSLTLTLQYGLKKSPL